MTEAQLKVYPEFRALPIFDESDKRADTITTVSGAGNYRSIRECWTLFEVEECLKNPKFVPLGGLRAGNSGAPIVVAYFGEKT